MLSSVEFQELDADVAGADCSTTETCICFSSGTLRSCLPSLTLFSGLLKSRQVSQPEVW